MMSLFPESWINGEVKGMARSLYNNCPWDKSSCRILQSVLVVHYSLNFTAYKAASGRVFFRCGTPNDAV